MRRYTSTTLKGTESKSTGTTHVGSGLAATTARFRWERTRFLSNQFRQLQRAAQIFLLEQTWGHIHLEVSSLDAFSSLYEDVIGFERQVELPAARFVAAGGYHHHIGANTWNRRSRPVAGRGLAWFEVLLPDTETLYAIQDRTASSHYSVTETDDGISITGPNEIEIRFRA